MPFSRERAMELSACEIDLVFTRDVWAIRRNFVIEPNSAVRPNFAFSVCGAPVAVDVDVLPLLPRHKGDTWKPRMHEQEEFSGCGCAVHFRQK